MARSRKDTSRMSAATREMLSSHNQKLEALKSLSEEVNGISAKAKAGTATSQELRRLTVLRRQLSAKTEALTKESRALAKQIARDKGYKTSAARKNLLHTAAYTASLSKTANSNSEIQEHAATDESKTTFQQGSGNIYEIGAWASSKAGSVAEGIDTYTRRSRAQAQLKKDISAAAIQQEGVTPSIKQPLPRTLESSAAKARTSRGHKAASSKTNEPSFSTKTSAAKKRKVLQARARKNQARTLQAKFYPTGLGARIKISLKKTILHPFGAVKGLLVKALIVLLVVNLIIFAPFTLIGSVMPLLSSAVMSAAQAQTDSAGAALVRVVVAEYEAGERDGTHHFNDSKYWDYVFGGGFTSGAATPWCAAFISWCANEVGYIDSGLFPRSGAVATYIDWFSQEGRGQIYPGGKNYLPRAGDLICYSGTSHIGVITQVEDNGDFYTIEGNTSYTAGLETTGSTVNKKFHAKNSTGWSAIWGGIEQATFIRPAYPTQGSDIVIPDDYGKGGFTVTEYDAFFGRWTLGTAQARVSNVWNDTGKTFTDHIATINGCYLIACTPKFGAVGDRVDFYLEDGTKIPCIIADQKRVTALENSNEWGHNQGQNIIEFEVESSYFRAHGNPGSSTWMSQWQGKRVAGATNLGSVY